AGWLERAGLIWLAVGCVVLGLAPVAVLEALDAVDVSLLGNGIGEQSAHWWLLTPVAAQRASYSPIAFAAGLAVAVVLPRVGVRRLYHGRARHSDPWDCGFPAQTGRMQDTAEGFGQPIRHVFGPFFHIERELPTPFDRAPQYALRLGDRWWDWLYLPVA